MNETITKNHTLRGVLCTTIGGVCWGFSGTCGQYLFMHYEVSSLWLTCVRLLTAGILLSAAAAVRSRETFAAVWRQPREVLQIALYGICGLALCQYSYMTSISYSNAATTTVLQNLSLVFIMLISCLRIRRKPNCRESVSLVLALAGTYILATGGNPGHLAISSKGLFWGIMTAVAVTIYTILPRKLLPRWGRETITGLGMLFGGIFVNLAARSWTYEVHLPVQGWLALVAIIVFGSLVAFPLFMQGVTDIGPVKSSMLAATEPVAAAVFSAVWLKTQFTVASLVGFACIIVTIFLLAKSE
ncbi:MAG: DMT family transporter [Oscillibacter sp.]|nr:DMT family transporter [Oscillibacter sp.]